MVLRKEGYKDMKKFRKTRNKQRKKYYNKYNFSSKKKNKRYTKKEEILIKKHLISDRKLAKKLKRSVMGIQLKRNHIKLIILFLVILLIPTIFAVEVSINNNPVKIKINNNTLEITSQYGINNKNITFNLVHSNITISTNETNITTDLCFIPPQEFTFDNYYLQNTSAFIDLDVNKRLIDCEIEKGLSKQNTTNCLNDLGSCKTENSTNLRNDLNSCNMSLAIKTMETQKSKEDSDRLILETDVKKNEKYTWGIGGLILGVLAILLYLGKIGKGTVKDRSVDEFNRQSVG